MTRTPKYFKVRPKKAAADGMRSLESFGFSAKKVVRWSRPPIRLSVGMDPYVASIKEVSKPPQLNATEQAWDTVYQDYWSFWTNVAQYIGIFQDGRHAHSEWLKLKKAYVQAYLEGTLENFKYACAMDFLRKDWRFHSHDKKDREVGGKYFGKKPLA